MRLCPPAGRRDIKAWSRDGATPIPQNSHAKRSVADDTSMPTAIEDVEQLLPPCALVMPPLPNGAADIREPT